MQFVLDRNIDGAAQDVQNAIAAMLPEAAAEHACAADDTEGESRRPADPLHDASSTTLSLPAVDEYAENIIAQRISMLDGVAQVNVFGAQKFAVRVQLDPNLLASRGIGIDEVQGAWQAQRQSPVRNAVGTAPSLYGRGERPADRLPTRSVRLIVTYRNGSPVRLGEIAKVVDSVQNDQNCGLVQRTTRAIMLQIQRQPGTNTVEVATGSRSLMPEFRGQIPPAIEMDTSMTGRIPISRIGERRQVHARCWPWCW